MLASDDIAREPVVQPFLDGLRFPFRPWLRLAVALLALAGASSARAWPVVQGGEARAVVVRNTDGDAVTALAVEELVEHIREMTGVRLPQVEADAWDRGADRPAIVIGRGALLEELGVDLGELPWEGYRIVALPDRPILVLAGMDEGSPWGTAHPRNRRQSFGTLYAAYALLEHWGVRWLFPGDRGMVLPARAELHAPMLDRTDGPDFRRRNLWLREEEPRERIREEGSPQRAARLWALRNRAGNSIDTYATGHHSPRWWDLWAETHPVSLYLPPMFGAWPLWDYGGLSLPVLTLRNVHEGFRFSREHGVAGVLLNPNFASNNVGSHGLLAYASARWLWDADRTPDDILADFSRHAFGDGAPAMELFFRAIDWLQSRYPLPFVPRENAGFDRWMEHHLQVFTPSFVAALHRRIDEALARVRESAERERVLIFQQNLVFTDAQLSLERAWRTYRAEPAGGMEAVRSAFRRCEELYAQLWPENRPDNPLFQRGDAARAVQEP